MATFWDRSLASSWPSPPWWAVATAVTRLTLDEAIAMAIAENPTLRAKELELRASQANEITAAVCVRTHASYSAEQLRRQPPPSRSTPWPSASSSRRGASASARSTARGPLRVTGLRARGRAAPDRVPGAQGLHRRPVGQAALALADQNLQTWTTWSGSSASAPSAATSPELELLRIQVQRFAVRARRGRCRQAVSGARVALRGVLAPARWRRRGDRGRARRSGRAAHPAELEQAASPTARNSGRRRPAARSARANFDLARANATWDFSPQIQYQRIGN
jgi:hypothetical protein